MNNMQYIMPYRRYILLSLCLIGVLMLQGCAFVMPWLEEAVQGDMNASATTSCQINSVANMSGAHEYICQNSSEIYIYHNGGIYEYDTMVEIVNVDHLEYMACNEDVLYYSVATNQGELYCYNFTDNTSTMISDAYRVVGMKSCEDDVFISTRTKEGIEYGLNGNVITEYPYELLYCHGTESPVNLNEWASMQNEKNMIDNYEIYEFEGYHLIADVTIEETLPQLVYVENKDGFQYSCYGYNTYGKVGDSYICLTRDGKYRYQNTEYQLPLISDLYLDNLATVYAGFSSSQIGFYNDYIYILVQYSSGTSEYRENPSKDYKVGDALFRLCPETGECELIYNPDKNKQIVGFSASQNDVYILRNAGVYRYDLETEDEECILNKTKYLSIFVGYDTLVFEYFNDELFVYHDPGLGAQDMEFLCVIE